MPDQVSNRNQVSVRQIDIWCNREQGALKEQLQVHIQTIGILVSEKSDLQSAVSHARSSLKQKSGKCPSLPNPNVSNDL